MPNFERIRRKGDPLFNSPGQSGSRGLPPDPSKYYGVGGTYAKREPWPGGKEISELQAVDNLEKGNALRRASVYNQQQYNEALQAYLDTRCSKFGLGKKSHKEYLLATENIVTLQVRANHHEYKKISDKQTVDKAMYSRELLEKCNKAISEWGPDGIIYHAKGDALRNLKRPEEALEAYNKAIEIILVPQNTIEPRVSRIKILLTLQKFNEAIAQCDKDINFLKYHLDNCAHIFIKDFVKYKTEALKGLENKWFDLGYQATESKLDPQIL